MWHMMSQKVNRKNEMKLILEFTYESGKKDEREVSGHRFMPLRDGHKRPIKVEIINWDGRKLNDMEEDVLWNDVLAAMAMGCSYAYGPVPQEVFDEKLKADEVN